MLGVAPKHIKKHLADKAAGIIKKRKTFSRLHFTFYVDQVSVLLRGRDRCRKIFSL